MDHYNFYGDYGNNDTNDFSFSVFDIHKKQQQKEEKRMMIYNKILKRVFRKIKLAVDGSHEFCLYQMPEYIPGFPIYNMTECLFYIINFLTSKGFQSKYCHPLVIFITWPSKQKSLKLENLSNTKLIDNGGDTTKRVDIKPQPQFRPINDYNPKGDFLYNSNLNKIKTEKPKTKKRELFFDF